MKKRAYQYFEKMFFSVKIGPTIWVKNEQKKSKRIRT